MGWTAIQDAMQAGIARAANAGVPASKRISDDRVIWKFQNAGQPALGYIALDVGTVENPGQDGLVASTDLTRPAGEEVRLDVVGFRECVLSLEIFTAKVADDFDARGIGERIRSALLLPTIRDVFSAVGVSPFEPGAVQFAPSIVAVGFRGRALLDIRCFAPAEELFEFTGYIARVGGTLRTLGGGAGPDDRAFEAP